MESSTSRLSCLTAPGRILGPACRRLPDPAGERDPSDRDNVRPSVPTSRIAALAVGSWRWARGPIVGVLCTGAVGRPVRGRVLFTGPGARYRAIEDSTARLSARTSTISTGAPLPDRLLAGDGFLDAAGDRLPIRAAGLGSGQTAPPASLSPGSWVIDSRWITSQRIPALGRRVVMTCPFPLQPDMWAAGTAGRLAASGPA